MSSYKFLSGKKALTYGHKKSADPPYSQLGLRQPLQSYGEACAKAQLQ